MLVNKVVETPMGTIKFEGELTEAEADTVIKIGLTVLMQAGQLKLVKDTTDTEGMTKQ
jgi:hypothetical protein